MSYKKNILHLCSYFSGISAVYENLFQNIDALGYTQKVYVPYRQIKRRKEVTFLNPNSEVLWRPILNDITRFAYFYKIKKIYKDVVESVDLKEIDCIHAHTWYTDGGVAYKLFKKYNIPYTITVRGTDLSVFSKYFIHTHGFAKAILINAEQIIFVSKALERKVLNLPFLSEYAEVLKPKFRIIPNGVDEFWIKNVQVRKKIKSQDLKLVYVGNFTRGKNISRLIDALDIIKKSFPNVSLTIVGGGYSYSKQLVQRIENHENINFLGKILDKELLMEVIRENDIFVMPSYNETFGLVYIEALSQGIPVIYSKNDGIDGFHVKRIGEGVHPKNVDDIVKNILKIYNSYDEYDFNPQDIVKKHNWLDIAKSIYNT